MDIVNQAGADNISVNQGEALQFDVEVLGEDNEAFDLTGYTAKMQIKTAPDAEDAVAEAAASISGNKISLTFSREKTAAMPTAGKKSWADYAQFVYDLIIYKDDDFIRLMNGQFLVSPQVTKI